MPRASLDPGDPKAAKKMESLNSLILIAAAGTLRQLDTAVVAARNLATFLYQEASPFYS